jgi:hypothetical protein
MHVWNLLGSWGNSDSNSAPLGRAWYSALLTKLTGKSLLLVQGPRLLTARFFKCFSNVAVFKNLPGAFEALADQATPHPNKIQILGSGSQASVYIHTFQLLSCFLCAAKVENCGLSQTMPFLCWLMSIIITWVGGKPLNTFWHT